MGIYSIENECLKVSVANHGSELCSVYDKRNDREVIWQADPAFWKRYAPVLFPNVGQYYGGVLRHKGQSYKEGQHGFARDCEFELVTVTENTIVMKLTSSEETKKRYPFDFEFEVTHTLTENKVLVSWKVTNTGVEAMYFTIGGHPAFNVPGIPGTALTDYCLVFEDDKEELQYEVIDTSCGCVMPGETRTMKLKDHKYGIKADMFDDDALVFDNDQIKWVAIGYPDGSPYIALYGEGFPNFGIWSKPGAPYVCLEPWAGRCDNKGFEGEISQKPGINALEPESVFERSYTIEIA